MLTIYDESRRGSRRAFLRIGSLGLGSLGLGWCGLPSLAAAEPSSLGAQPLATGKSVILLFLHGGPSQFETFDPKMSAPAGVRSVTGETASRLPGITLGGTFPRLAARADQVALIRSFQTGNGNHDIKPVVSDHSGQANLGSLFARLAGSNHPESGMPTNVVLFPRAVDDAAQPANENFGNFRATGALGAALAPFVPGGNSGMGADLELKLPRERLDDRRHLLGKLDRLRRGLEAAGPGAGLDRLREQAFETILGGVAQAFDLGKETARTVAAYDTAPLVRPEQISRAWNNYQNYVDNARSLGKLLLLARRLCEQGCGFVTVTTNFVWDMHADVNNAGVEEGMRYMGLPLDHVLAAYLDDTRARGLDEQILLVVCGEMGRTPKVNARGGRDHWGSLAPLLLAGGGLAMGQVVGHSAPDGGEPAADPLTIRHLIGTIMTTLLDRGRVRATAGVPAEVLRVVTELDPIPGLHT